PSPQLLTKLPSRSNTTIGWAPRLKTWMRSLLSTATEATSVRFHPSGSFAQFSTTRYRCSPEPRMVGMLVSPICFFCHGLIERRPLLADLQGPIDGAPFGLAWLLAKACLA